MSSKTPQRHERIATDHTTPGIDPAKWKGPFQETDRYGCLTGLSYVRCRDCRREVPTSARENLTHAPGCKQNG